MYDRLAFELSSPGRIAYSLPESDVDVAAARGKIPAGYLRTQPAELPELSELDVVRHYSRLSGWPELQGCRSASPRRSSRSSR